MALKEKPFEITFSKFYGGFSSAAHLNTLTEMGSAGNASVMVDSDVLNPTCITQGPGLAELSNMSSLNEMMNFIMDVPSENGITYGIGDTKLFEITPIEITVIPPLGDELIINGSFTDNLENWVVGEGWTQVDGKAQYTYSATDLVTNGTFTGNANGWSLGARWTYNDNNIIHTVLTGTLAQHTFSQNIGGEDGKYYLVSFDASDTGGLGIGIGGHLFFTELSCIVGTNYYTVRASGSDGTLYIRFSATYAGTIDNISVVECALSQGGLNASTNYTISLNVGGTTGEITLIYGADVYGTIYGQEVIMAGSEVNTFTTVTFYYGTSELVIMPSVDFDGTIDDVSVKEENVVFPHIINSCTKGESVVFMTTPPGGG